MERYTYEITFTRLDGQPNEVQEYTDRETAQEAFRMFDEEDSAELYSEIRLTEIDWLNRKDTLLDALSF